MLISRVVKDVCTGIDGVTYDPARLIGYGFTVIAACVWLGATIFEIVKNGHFDGTNFAISLGGVSAALIAAAGGVAFKNSSEPPAAVTPPVTSDVTTTPTPVTMTINTPPPNTLPPPLLSSVNTNVDTSLIPQNNTKAVLIPQFSIATDKDNVAASIDKLDIVNPYPLTNEQLEQLSTKQKRNRNSRKKTKK